MKMMIAFTFDPADREQVMPLVPQEQARVRELRDAGIVEALYLGANGAGGWLVMTGADAAAITASLESLPMHPFMTTTLIQLRD